MKTNQVGRTLLGHKQWVTALCWEPLHLTSVGQSGRMASAGKDGDVRIWNTRLGTCEKVCQKKSIYIGLYFTYRLDNFIIMFIMLKGQNQELCIFYVVCSLLFCFLFFFLIFIHIHLTWVVSLQILSNHMKCVTALRWSGEGLIYSASQDRTIKVWRAADVSSFITYYS